MVSFTSTKMIFILSFILTLSYIPTFLLADSSEDEQKLLYGQQKWNWKDIFAKKISVEIKNKLEGGEPITFVCKSIDDNLGTHTLYPGQSYEWSFRKAVFGETRQMERLLSGF